MDRTDLRGVVEEFFERMADDDRRSTVGGLFAADVTVSLPGAVFSGPDAADEMLAYFTAQYQWVEKEFDRWYVDEDTNTVVSAGTLHGVDNAGSEFADVRYLDLYEVRNGAIVRMEVYNDLVDEGVVSP